MSSLATTFCGIPFRNPIVLASGTAAYGRELADIADLEAVGGLVTKAVSLQPRAGAPAPRVSFFPGGMVNAIGLANPGVDVVRATELPWCAAHLRDTKVLVNVVGYAVDDFANVIARLDDLAVIAGYELNVSCPNVKAGGLEFGADRAMLAELVRLARAATRRPIVVKLSPTLPDLPGTAGCVAEAGADAVTLVNTLPGLVVDGETRRPVIGFGSGGTSGPPLLPVGVLATWRVTRAHPTLPVIGLGGVFRVSDAVSYLMAGATLVGMGTAGMVDPRAPERVARGLARWCDDHGVRTLDDLRGTLQWPN
ncbi:MAG: dihydroorotate dehydrogenase [Gemmatimonadaceae bacterium]|nr:dihydroorotate dehydrogenase [Gemmatimonadaceae bacterium]